MAVTTINMRSVSLNLQLRAFTAIIEAHRWLDTRMSGERRLTGQFPAVQLPNSVAPTSTSSSASSERPTPVTGVRSRTFQPGTSTSSSFHQAVRRSTPPPTNYAVGEEEGSSTSSSSSGSSRPSPVPRAPGSSPPDRGGRRS
jgi:hypothetical protein